MTITRFFGYSARVVGLTAFAASAQGASLVVDFQATIASENNTNGTGEARYYHVSVNPDNAGIGSYAANDGAGDAADAFTHSFAGDVVSYKWIGGTNNDISGVAVSGGEADRISYATEDTVFDGFAQGQLRLWTTTDPGPDFATGAGLDATPDGGGGGYRSFGGAVVTVDIADITSGSVYVFYGAFSATPSVSAVMRDTDGLSPDITITDAHLNGDRAARTEYYVAELKFVNDAGYDEIVYTHLANGTDFTGNGRGLGTVLIGPDFVVRPLVITEIIHDSDTNMLTLTWNSEPGETYAVKWSTDMTDWDADLDDGIPASADETTTETFDLTEVGLEDEVRVFFRVEKL